MTLDDFSSLFVSKTNCSSFIPGVGDNYIPFNEHMSVLEIKKAVDNAKRGKALGADSIYTEVLKNDVAILVMLTLFNICFDKGSVPSIWGKCIINPIPKSSSSDPRDPLTYRGIALASSVYKIYCAVLNNRLNLWVENNDKLEDEQCGFRKRRSTIDQLLALTNLVDTRKKLKQSTFTAFVNFKKAYDFINRDKLWKRLLPVRKSLLWNSTAV